MANTPSDLAAAAGHDSPTASAWVQRWSHLAKPAGSMLDLACGRGRHMAWFAAQGLDTTGIDRSADALAQASRHGRVIQSDLEGADWPLLQDGKPLQFDVVVVTNYLWRALFPSILQSLAPGGLLIYETFAQGHERHGRPTRPEFLLRPAELLNWCQELHVVAYEHGFLTQPERCVQRIVAMAAADASRARCHPLSLK